MDCNISILIIHNKVSGKKELRIHSMRRPIEFWSTRCFLNLFDQSSSCYRYGRHYLWTPTLSSSPSSPWAHLPVRWGHVTGSGQWGYEQKWQERRLEFSFDYTSPLGRGQRLWKLNTKTVEQKKIKKAWVAEYPPGGQALCRNILSAANFAWALQVKPLKLVVNFVMSQKQIGVVCYCKLP